MTTPSGPPPSGPPRSGAAAGAAAGGSGISPKALIGIGLVVAIGVGVLVGVLVAGGDDEAKAEDVQLVSATEPGPNPFTPPVAPEAPPPNTLAPPSGPFGGTGDNALCDREGIITFLTDPANSAQASEWARVVGIQVSEIPTYVRELVPTTVTSDTRITNHTFENGKAVSFQAVLQAGTAVLVDVYGKPVVRCRCGNPLLPPRDISKPTYTGTRWPGFDPTTIIVIQVTEVQIFPPGGVGEIPPQEEPEPDPEPEPGGDEDEAAAIMRAGIEECVASGGGGDPAAIASLGYTATATGTPDVYSVVVNEPESGEFGTWTVNVATRDITAADPIAAEVGAFCPNLA